MSIRIEHGCCLEVMVRLCEEGVLVDSVVTDPPYGLQFMGQEWDRLWRNNTEADRAYVGRTDGKLTSRARKLPDYSATKPAQMQAWHLQWCKAALDLLKPGGHMLVFGGARTYHRLACAIEDAGFEIRDQIQWLYGSGFPKSHDVSKGIDKGAGHWRGRPAPATSENVAMGGPNYERTDKGKPISDAAKQWEGWGTALKPACEPIVLARKPLEGTVATNVLEHGTGALNIDGCRVGTETRINPPGSTNPRNSMGDGWREDAEPTIAIGRWPANVIHDGSEEVLQAFARFGKSGGTTKRVATRQRNKGWCNSSPGEGVSAIDNFGDSGTAARFFYTAKADKADRLGSKHPTVKPVDLMAYLCRLITPPGGLVLDPFAGSGTTAMAALREGFDAILIEKEAAFVADIKHRIAHVEGADTPLFLGEQT